MKRIIRYLSILLGLCILCTACGTKTDTEVEDAEIRATEVPATEVTAVDTQVIEPGNIHQVVIATDEIIQPIEMGKTMLADLDGDGEPEMITVRRSSYDNGYSVNKHHLYFQVNDLYYNGNDFGKLVPNGYLYSPSFYLVDLDTSDRFKEILIFDSMDMSYRGHFIRYNRGEMIPISGNIDRIRLSGDSVSICGDGTVKVREDIGLFRYEAFQKTWKLIDANHFHTVLEDVTDFYEFGLRPTETKYTLRQEMTFFAQMDGNLDNLITLPAGTKIDIFGYYPNTGWVQFLYDDATKEAWMKLVGGSVLLPMNIYKSDIVDDYIDGFPTGAAG